MNRNERIEQTGHYDMLFRKRYIQLRSLTEHFPEDCTSYVEAPVETLREDMATLSAVRSHLNKLKNDLRASS